MARKGSESCAWRGGKFKREDGYVQIYRPAGYETDCRLYLMEHILVMERHLGRPLYKDETVHHKNGIRDDNRIENLELWASRHCPGQRASDLVAWAKEILVRYNEPVVSPCCV